MSIDDETTRLMLNWAQWRTGASVSMAMSGCYTGMAAGDSYDTPMPLLNGEAIEVNQAVERLEPHQGKAVTEFWCYSGNPYEKAARLGCSPAAMYRRLEQAHAFVHAYRRELRAKAERARKALSQSHSENRTLERESACIIPLPLRSLRQR